VIQKEAEKILKYKDLTIEIQRMWNVKTRVIPVIIGVTGIISKSFRKYVSTIPGNHELKELQKTAILGTAHILQKVLMQKYIRANAGASVERPVCQGSILSIQCSSTVHNVFNCMCCYTATSPFPVENNLRLLCR
jgi:hypothetical protein